MTINRRCKEKYEAALHCLAVREGDVRNRLRGAYRYLNMLSEDEVPQPSRAEWKSILKALTRRGPEIGPNGDIYKNALEHTMSRIQNRTGRKIAERIYMLVRYP